MYMILNIPRRFHTTVRLDMSVQPGNKKSFGFMPRIATTNDGPGNEVKGIYCTAKQAMYKRTVWMTTNGPPLIMAKTFKIRRPWTTTHFDLLCAPFLKDSFDTLFPVKVPDQLSRLS